MTPSPSTEDHQACPYLDTVQRSLLDFDLEPACSITLSKGNVYSCLVCGKFFRGRGAQTPAYIHAVEESHYVFMHLEKGTFHCLPDDYTIHDASLNDIRAALQPTFTSEQIQSLDGNSEPSRDLFGRRYLPGFVGLSNLNKTDGINCVVQALAHVRPLRNYFLSQSNHNTLAINNAQNQLSIQVTHAFGQLVRKLWSPDRFKSNVDPHELVHYISVASKKRFGVGQQCEVGDLMTWLLHHFHVGTGGTKKPNSSIIHTTFQGQLRMTTKEKKRKRVQDQSNEDDRGGSDAESDREDEFKMENSVKQQEPEFVLEESIVDTQFLQLTLDLPDKPLFRDEDGGLVIPQEPLSTVLKKFDGISFSDAVTKSGVSQRKQYRLLKLPDYLILCLARFKKNSYTRVKNPAIVAFPLKNLDLSEYVKPDGGRKSIPTQEQVEQMGIKDLKRLLTEHGRKDIAAQAVEKSELVSAAIDFVSKSLPALLADKYDLVANITHVSPADVGREGTRDALEEGYYKCHVQNRSNKQWFEIHDDNVVEVMPQQIGLSESYLLIFERHSVQQKL